MNQQACDLEFDAIVAGLMPPVDRLPERRPTAAVEVRRIASAAFCGVGIHPSVVAFAVRRTALRWGLDEADIDLAVTAELLTNATRVREELRGLDPL